MRKGFKNYLIIAISAVSAVILFFSIRKHLKKGHAIKPFFKDADISEDSGESMDMSDNLSDLQDNNSREYISLNLDSSDT